MTAKPEIGHARQLADPFPEADIEWRIQRSGVKNGKPWAMCLAYITNRAIMDRLDAVLGPENWRNEFVPWGDRAVACGLSLRLAGEWITKWDGAEQTDVESVKGGFSAAMKRAAVQWGIGRYLYNLEEGWATIGAGPYSAKIEGEYYKWAPPKLPSWALPKNGQPPLTRQMKAMAADLQGARAAGVDAGEKYQPPTAKELTEVPVPLRAPEPMPWDGKSDHTDKCDPSTGEIIDYGEPLDAAEQKIIFTLALRAGVTKETFPGAYQQIRGRPFNGLRLEDSAPLTTGFQNMIKERAAVKAKIAAAKT